MRILCFGDSNTYGYDPRSYFGGRYGPEERWVDLLSGLCGAECVNLGSNGRSIPRPGAGPAPGAGERLIVMLGANDILSGAAAEECAHRMEAFLSGCALTPGSALIVAPPALVPGEWTGSRGVIAESRALADAYRPLAARMRQHFADASLWGVELAYDGVHFTGAGHRSFAAGVADAVRNAFNIKEV